MMRVLCFLLGGTLFGVGLAISGMTQPEVVLSFLLFEDLGLGLVMGGAIAVALPVFRVVKKPLFATHTEPFKAWLTLRTVSGSILFGVGWGISGACPGAALASLGTLNAPVTWAVLAMFVGGYLQGILTPSPTSSAEPAHS